MHSPIAMRGAAHRHGVVWLSVASALVVAMLTSGCAGLPPLQPRQPVQALEPAIDGQIALMVKPLVAAHPGVTGVVPLGDGREALGVRLALARRATRSIDVQTFIWKGDATGTVLFEDMLAAAERGVRVRMLIDDANTSGLDRTLSLLASHPNLELRLYNPFVYRGSRLLGYMTDFTRLNHRMHNKSFTVDNLITVVGGRNIADEYFEAGDQTGMVDLDVIAVGDAVKAVSAEFDTYWNSASAYPARSVLAHIDPEPRDALAQRARAVQDDPSQARFGEVVLQLPVVSGLLRGTLDPEWVRAVVAFDDPAKTLDTKADKDLLLFPRLQASMGKPVKTIDIVSPYFVAGEDGVAALSALARSGVRVRVLTNSLAATDEKSVHSGYTKRRLPLLRAGVELLELRPDATSIQDRSKDIGRGSKAGLHAKTYAVDGRAIFVGSFNFDPRSARLNTEMGMVIESARLASRLAGAVDIAYPTQAYRLGLDEEGDLQWLGADGKVYRVDPGSSWWERAVVEIGTWLPIEWLL